jgi:ABC-type molybdate transport system substrate-binding protein
LISSSLSIKDGHPVSLAILLLPSSDQGDKIFVIYAGSLVKTFEQDIGPAFQSRKGIFIPG